jgi:hypothetical protein
MKTHKNAQDIPRLLEDNVILPVKSWVRQVIGLEGLTIALHGGAHITGDKGLYEFQ